MNKAEKDLLIIKRDGLLKMKRLVDIIEKIRQISDANDFFISTIMYKLAEGLQINDYGEIQSLLSKANSETIASFSITTSGVSWATYRVMIFLPVNFNEISHKVRNDYHKLNDLLINEEKVTKNVSKELIGQEVRTIKENSLWKLTHPAYWISKGYLFFKKHPSYFLVVAVVVIGIILIKFCGWEMESFDFYGLKIVPNNE